MDPKYLFSYKLVNTFNFFNVLKPTDRFNQLQPCFHLESQSFTSVQKQYLRKCSSYFPVPTAVDGDPTLHAAFQFGSTPPPSIVLMRGSQTKINY